MPTRDEDGNLIGLDAFPIYLRGDDAREYVFPGSIPETELDLTATSEDPEEHDFLPPMENTGSWTLSGDGFKKLMEAIDKVVKSLNSLTVSMIPIGRKSRQYRKVVRWDERNRRRRLRGLPEKPCPYPRIWKTCIIQQKEEYYDRDSYQHPAEVLCENHGPVEALGDAENQTKRARTVPGVHLSD